MPKIIVIDEPIPRDRVVGQSGNSLLTTSLWRKVMADRIISAEHFAEHFAKCARVNELYKNCGVERVVNGKIVSNKPPRYER